MRKLWPGACLFTLLTAAPALAQADLGSTITLEPMPGIADQSAHVQAALERLPAQRQQPAELRLIGDFTLLQPLLLDNYTTLNLHSARLRLRSKENHSVLKNRAGEGGNHHIQILGGEIVGNRSQIKGRGASCVHLQNSSHIRIEHLEVSKCALDGVLIDGRGKKARIVYVQNLNTTHNLRDGLVLTWAVRDATVDTVIARHNGRYGVYSDHSESDYSNIRASRNRLDGIFVRNVFHNSYRHLRTRHNGRHGIAIQGMVESTGSDWRSHNNGAKSDPDAAADIFFSADSSLSYGISKRLLLEGVIAGPSKSSAPGKSSHALRVEPPGNNAENYDAVQLSNILLLGDVSLPASSAGFKVLSPLTPTATSND